MNMKATKTLSQIKTVQAKHMDAQQFAYWLQGFAELTDKPPTAEQWKSIRDHLQLVFVKVTPMLGQQILGIEQTPWPPATVTC